MPVTTFDCNRNRSGIERLERMEPLEPLSLFNVLHLPDAGTKFAINR